MGKSEADLLVQKSAETQEAQRRKDEFPELFWTNLTNQVWKEQTHSRQVLPLWWSHNKNEHGWQFYQVMHSFLPRLVMYMTPCPGPSRSAPILLFSLKLLFPIFLSVFPAGAEHVMDPNKHQAVLIVSLHHCGSPWSHSTFWDSQNPIQRLGTTLAS